MSVSIVKKKILDGSKPSVFLLLDGFDDITDEQREAAGIIINHLLKNENGIKRIILTSRPEDTLEKRLVNYFEQQLFLRLNNFGREDQIKYLVQCWSAKLASCDKQIGSEEKIQTYVKELVDYAEKVLYDEDGRTFLEIPLHCMAVSLCFFEKLERFLESTLTPSFHADTNFELSHLYDRLFNLKTDFLLDKIVSEELKNDARRKQEGEQKKCFLKSLRNLSIHYIMKNPCDAQVLNRKDYDKVVRKDLETAVVLGFLRFPPTVQDSGDEKSPSNTEPKSIMFLHRTFAEYFFASYIADHLTKKDSELFDKVDKFGMSPKKKEETLCETFKIVNEKILATPGYAGVRRFLNEMLLKCVPTPEYPCPFAGASRNTVFKNWPAIGHEQFNEHLAAYAILKFRDFFKKWTEDEQNTTNSTEILLEHLRALRQVFDGNTEELGLAGIIHGHGDKLLSITVMLIHCIKEYACRKNIKLSGDRLKLAHFFTLISLVWLDNPNRTIDNCYPGDNRKKIIKTLFHWFDKALDLSDDENSVFSMWLTKLTSVLQTSHFSNQEFIQEVLIYATKIY